MLIYFLIYKFLPEKKCTYIDYNGSHSCDCIGIKKLYDIKGYDIKGTVYSCIGVRQRCYSYNAELDRHEETPCNNLK